MFIPPMLLEKREQPFDDPQYLYEPKIDGHRLILYLSKGRLQLFTRHNTEVTNQYPELHDVPVSCREIVLDGEVAYVNPETGAVEFETVMSRFKSKNPFEAATRLPVNFFVFDVLWIDGEDVRSRTLMERKEILDKVLTNNAYISRVIGLEGEGIKLFDVIKKRGLEGIVAKRKDSRYVCRRSRNWLKIINYTYVEVRIAGYRKNEFGWIVQYEGRYAGVIELSVSAFYRKVFYGVAKNLTTGEDKKNVYIQPVIKVLVRTRNWTKIGLLRSPEFIDFVF